MDWNFNMVFRQSDISSTLNSYHHSLILLGLPQLEMSDWPKHGVKCSDGIDASNVTDLRGT